jgi:hypothetical protein
MTLARKHRLSVYDASYLELAQRETLPLATRDADLIRAARAETLSLIGAAGCTSSPRPCPACAGPMIESWPLRRGLRCHRKRPVPSASPASGPPKLPCASAG